MNKISKITSIFGLRDLFVFGGLGLVGYGIWQVNQWLAFVVCGAILMLLGLGLLQKGN
jgi:hypothetical protein